MQASELVLFFVASSGVGLGIFFSLFLWQKDRLSPYSNQILGLLLFFLSLRIAKSVFFNFLELPLWIRNCGLAFTLAVGPLLLLYGRSLLQKKLPSRSNLSLHFLPAFLYLLGSPWIPNGSESELWYFLYPSILVQSFAYVIAATSLYPVVKSMNNVPKQQWYLLLCIGISAMWLIYAFIFIKWVPVYLAGALSFTFLVFSLSYFALRQKSITQTLFEVKYKSSPLSQSLQEQLLNALQQKLQEEKLFLKANLSIQELAKELDENPKLISQLINTQTGKNFSAFLNAYRVDFARRLLHDPAYAKEKMFTIALDSGFNSLSTFNLVFKQHTQMTPTAYRKAKSHHLAS